MKSKIIISIYLAFTTLLFSCMSAEMNSNTTSTGAGGSLARFAVVDNYLYTVSSESMNVFDISTDSNPELETEVWLGWGIETIFPQDSLLFLGANDGMHIYNISDQLNPLLVSTYNHIVSCDPVVVEGNKAFVTLHSSPSSNWCNGSTNELHIIDISEIIFPTLLTSYPMTFPLGLGVEGNKLFLCDDGLKVYNVEDPFNIELINHYDINANDIIILENHLLVIGDDGLYQYSYDGANLEFISKLDICSNNIIP
jgi:hypothetical protein